MLTKGQTQVSTWSAAEVAIKKTNQSHFKRPCVTNDKHMFFSLPSGKRLHNYGKSPFNGQINYNFQFSIAMLNYHRVNHNF